MPVDLPLPSVEVLAALVVSLREELTATRAELELAQTRICELEARMIKLRQKVSGCQRTLTGAKQFCAIRSYLSTAAKHGMHFFDALVRLTGNQPWMPAAA